MVRCITNNYNDVDKYTTTTVMTKHVISENYQKSVGIESDINEHIPTLSDYAEQCNSVCEFGVGSGVPTWGFVHGLLKSFKKGNLVRIEGYDVSPAPEPYLQLAVLNELGFEVLFRQGNHLKAPPVSCDLLFIDSFHVYGHLKRELALHAAGVRKFIIMHDTTVDEWDGELRRLGWNCAEYAAKTGIPESELTVGLWPAISEFLSANAEWSLHKRFTNNNGLTILQRVEVAASPAGKGQGKAREASADGSLAHGGTMALDVKLRVHVSFMTTIKICKGYEWLIDAITLYVKNVHAYATKFGVTYEILICEQLDERNIVKIGDVIDLAVFGNVTILPLQQTYYNPHGYNLIEAYGKNACLARATGLFTCMTSADQMFSEEFFSFIATNLSLGVFYRFATFEVPKPACGIASQTVDEMLAYCKAANGRLCNPGCFDHEPPFKAEKLAEKSGDVMLLDTASFLQIKGWPEAPYYAYMDGVVCAVACNVFTACVPERSVCTFTFEQTHRFDDKFGRDGQAFYGSYLREKRRTCN